MRAPTAALAHPSCLIGKAQVVVKERELVDVPELSRNPELVVGKLFDSQLSRGRDLLDRALPGEDFLDCLLDGRGRDLVKERSVARRACSCRSPFFQGR